MPSGYGRELWGGLVRMSMNDSCFLFRPIQKTKQGEVLRESGQISYSCLRDLFCKKLDYLGFAASDFWLHSLRAGGATAAANAGVPDRLFKGQLKWKIHFMFYHVDMLV